MRIISWEDFITGQLVPTAITIGVFDGVHRGHQRLIDSVVRTGPNPTVITFTQNPKQVLYPQRFSGSLCSLKRKVQLFEQMGIVQTILIDFSGNFSTLKGREFVEYLLQCGLRFLVIGSNFRCGYRLDTDAAAIAAYTAAHSGVTTEVCAPVMDGSEPVSSSRIRHAIRTGNLTMARQLLGREPGLDLDGCKAEPGDAGTWFDAAGRVLPPDGRYRLTVFGTGDSERTEVIIADNRVFVPGTVINH
jgi:riboflavin kinase/FMN adenylyltransferase